MSGKSRKCMRSTVRCLRLFALSFKLLSLEGPIIRINPHEIHINDPEYINEVYAGPSTRRDKYRWVGRLTSEYRAARTSSIGWLKKTDSKSVFTTRPHELHRKRRAAMNTFFSIASIRRLEPIIQDIITQLFNRMHVCERSGELMPINAVYKALTTDVITRYCFRLSTNHMTKDDFNQAEFVIYGKTAYSIHLLIHIGWLGLLVESLPTAICCSIDACLRVVAFNGSSKRHTDFQSA